MAFYDPNNSRIFVFALSTCVHCKRAKKLLNELGVDYDHVEVDLLSDDEMDKALKEMSKYNPGQSFPTIIYGSKVIVGDREDDIRQMAEKAQAAQ